MPFATGFILKHRKFHVISLIDILINSNQFLQIGYLINNSISLNSAYQLTFTTTEFPVTVPDEEELDPV